MCMISNLVILVMMSILFDSHTTHTFTTTTQPDPDPHFGGGFSTESSLNLISANQVTILMVVFFSGLLVFFIIMDVICCCSFKTGLIYKLVSCCSGNSSNASASSSTRRNLRSGSNSSIEGEKEMIEDRVNEPLNRHSNSHLPPYQQNNHVSVLPPIHQQPYHTNGHGNLPPVQTPIVMSLHDPNNIGSVV